MVIVLNINVSRIKNRIFIENVSLLRVHTRTKLNFYSLILFNNRHLLAAFVARGFVR